MSTKKRTTADYTLPPSVMCRLTEAATVVFGYARDHGTSLDSERHIGVRGVCEAEIRRVTSPQYHGKSR